MTAIGTFPASPRLICACGQPLEIEMERDCGTCVDCQCRESILSGKPLKLARFYKRHLKEVM